MMRRPSFAIYGILGAFVLGSAFPFYWSFLVASRDNSVLTGDFTLIPGGNFWTNSLRVFDTIPFWKALGNSFLVSGTVTLDRKSTRLNSSHMPVSRMPSSA